MVLHYSNGRSGLIKSRDMRICTFYSSWLFLNNKINTRDIPHHDAESCRQALNDLISRYYPNKEQQSLLLSEMETAREENILPAESFDWLKQDERAAFWLWAYLCKAGDYQIGFEKPANAELGQTWYQRLQLSISPINHQERMNIIVSFFDKIVIPTPPVNHLKKHVMEKLKDQWANIYNKPLPLKWLPDEDEAVLWAWDNLNKLQQEKSTPYGGSRFSLSTPGLTTWFTPFSHAERSLALRAALDIWDNTPDTKRLFLLNLNKAWNQQKLRQSRTDKKALNTYLKNETKMRLDFMADRSGLRISDMLEKLINEHYRKTCGGE